MTDDAFPTVRIGDTVLYRSYGTRDGRHAPAHLPLLVVEVHDEGPAGLQCGLLSGWVFYIDGMRFHERVPYSDDEDERATWFGREGV